MIFKRKVFPPLWDPNSSKFYKICSLTISISILKLKSDRNYDFYQVFKIMEESVSISMGSI